MRLRFAGYAVILVVLYGSGMVAQESKNEDPKPAAVEMKLSADELKGLTEALKDRDLVETKMALSQTQMQNLSMQQQMLAPEVEKARKATIDLWVAACKKRGIDPAKFSPDPATGDIIPVKKAN